MTPRRPYLVRAIYEWIIDNDLTPHVLVNAEHAGVEVPTQHIHEGKIILNINPSAVQNLLLGNELIEFSARFGTIASHIRIPLAAVMAIYARENGQGMVFSDEPDGEQPPPQRKPDKKPSLKIVK